MGVVQINLITGERLRPNLQHAIRLVPSQLMLDVDGGFCLDNKAG
jgi:hypothetical protein